MGRKRKPQLTTSDLFTKSPPTRVVNINIDTTREEWIPYDVYIGRRRRGYSGYFGNPYRISRDCPQCGRPMSRDKVIQAFERYARQRILLDAKYREMVGRLHGKVLGCYCAPRPCHGQVYARLAAELAENPEPLRPTRLFSLLNGELVEPALAWKHLQYLIDCDDADPLPF